jgi:hypothetical protein
MTQPTDQQAYYTSRSTVQAGQRCMRMRWLENYEGDGADGADGMGLVPQRLSVHLAIGLAVHAGMAVLLGEGQRAVDRLLAVGERTVGQAVEDFFTETDSASNRTEARVIESAAVEAALRELAEQTAAAGVEMDAEEAAAQRAEVAAGQVVEQSLGAAGESAIVIEFEGMDGAGSAGGAGSAVGQADGAGASEEIALLSSRPSFSAESYVAEELRALVEAMVRAWARRRWRPLLEQFEVLEVEREGKWKLAEWNEEDGKRRVVYFLSRHDGLLRERSTEFLYLQSFKTTRSWDRRKEMDAQVDMQGLSEAVDVERRLSEAWAWLHEPESQHEPSVSGLVSHRILEWLQTQPGPPTILGVRYEYLLKGSRREDKKAGPGEPRWNQDTPLIRPWVQDGITSEDRRWAWTWDWWDGGKSRRLDYRSWRKVAVWRQRSIEGWIDELDAGGVQEGAVDANGVLLDALGEQFVPVVVAYRNADEVLDLLEQLEAGEVRVMQAVEEVRRAEREEGYGGKRSALNRLFPQNRQACSYPGLCAYRQTATQAGFCFGGPDPWHEQGVRERFRVRVPNHPAEGAERAGRMAGQLAERAELVQIATMPLDGGGACGVKC